MTTSARSTSNRSTSSRRISVSRRSNGPANTSRSSSRSTRATAQTLSARPDWSHPHGPPDIRERLGGDGPRLVGAVGQDALQLHLVRADLLEALSHRSQVIDQGIGHRLLEGAVAGAVELP